MTSLRGLRRPPEECDARSSGPREASTRTTRPHTWRPPTPLTITSPRRARATETVSRLKNPASRILPEGVASGASSDPCFAKLRATRLPATLVHVQRLVGHLVHRLPVHAGPPGRDPDAELDRHRHLVRGVQVVERLPDAQADLARIALVRVRHGDSKLVAAEAPASVRRPHGALQLLGKHANRFVTDVVPDRVVDVLEVVEVDHHQCEPALVA